LSVLLPEYFKDIIYILSNITDIQGVPGGKDLTSGECSLGQIPLPPGINPFAVNKILLLLNYTDITQNTYIQS
jgi:hypothetical protein